MRKYICLIFISIFTCITCFSQTKFTGVWNWHTPGASFTLQLTQKQDSVIGYHCSVMQNGNRIDCSFEEEITIRGKLHGDSAVISFKSTYSRLFGDATIFKIASDTIKWKITKPPHGLYFIPRLAIMTQTNVAKSSN
jgi:hypothetical protein